MKRKIEISFPDDHTIVIKGDYDGLDEAKRVVIFDRLAQALDLTKEDRFLIGVVIAGGGISALGGPPIRSFHIASTLMDAVERIKNRKENTNETDAL